MKGRQRFFAYGTLAIAAIMNALTGKQFEMESATAPDYRRFRIKGQVYPGLLRQVGGVTPGRLYFDVDDRSMELIDQFEDDVYDRIGLQVKKTDGSLVRAEAYVIPPARSDLLSSEPWDPDAFWRESGDAYVSFCKRLSSSLDSSREA